MMKKRFFGILLVLSMLCAFIPITASAEYYNGLSYDYNYDNRTITITNGNTTGDVVIPREIDGWTVTTIADKAFSNCYDLTSVTIPDTVTNIGKDNFGYAPVVVDENNKYYSSADGVLYNKDKTTLIKYPKASEITSFAVPDGVITIDEEAFNLSELVSVTIPDSIKTISNNAFRCCYDLTDVNIGSGVTTIGTAAFGECKKLKITIDEDNQYFLVEDDVLYNKDKTELLQYLNGGLDFENYSKRRSFTIPDGVEIIANSAFYNCTALQDSITIPDSVKTIGDSAFYECKKLNDLTLGSGVTHIGDDAFESTYNLTSITVANCITNIGKDAFLYSGLKDLYFIGTEKEWNAVKGSNLISDEITIHFNPILKTTAEITKSETESTYTFSVNAEDKYEDCYVYAAVYNKNGELAEVKQVPLDTVENTSVSVDKNDSAKIIKIFLWTDKLQSIIKEAKVFEI